MDFIKGLPLSDGHDTILVIVCHLTNMALFIPTFQDIDAEDLVHLLVTGLCKTWHPDQHHLQLGKALHLSLLEVALPDAGY